MRVTAWLAAISCCVGCGQKPEHPALAPSCDPATMDCRTTTPGSGSGSNPGGDDPGAGGAGTDGGLADFTGLVMQLDSDYFDQGTVFPRSATVSATGDGGLRTSTTYDGTSFKLPNVLLAATNWFLIEPTGVGALPTLNAIPTRSIATTDLRLGLANTDAVDGIFLNSGTDRSLERAQLVLHVVDSQLRSVPGIRGTLSALAEVTEYRMAAAWVPDDGATSVTDDTGMLFFGNVVAGSAFTKGTVALTGTTTSRIEVELKVGAVTLVNAIVTGK